MEIGSSVVPYAGRVAHQVFISYSSNDKTAADAVCAALENNAIRCWIAPRDILPSVSYGESIIDAINDARILVLILSGHANRSPQVEREIERAVSRRIPIIPLRIEEVQPSKSLEYFISNYQWLDAFTLPFEQHLRRLVGVVQRVLATRHSTGQGQAGPEQDTRAGTEEPSPANAGPQLDAVTIGNRRGFVGVVAPRIRS